MPSKNIEDAAKFIQDSWESIQHEFIKSNPGRYLIITCSYRSPSEQLELFKKGRTMGTDGEWHVQHENEVVTNVDGFKVLGAHNYMPSRAIDVAVVNNQTGEVLWEKIHYYSLLGIAKAVGLESGGGWKSIKDWPHLQIPDYKHYNENI